MDYRWLLDTEGSAAVQQLGLCHIRMGDYEQARQHYQTAASLAPDRAEPHVGLGVIYLLEGHLGQAEAAFRFACQLDPTCSQAYAGLAVVQQQKGMPKAAFDLYLKSLQLDCDNLLALLGLFQTSCQMGSFAKIIHYLELYLQSHPQDSSVMFCLAALYVKDGRIKEARALLNELICLDPTNEDAANLLEEIDNSLSQRPVHSPAG
ncbi:MAG: tetratricopeptide repeat protein [Sedimentisphaerales bacterium]|jgi:Flp pilus assembly protein TadD|nr:tetratricopeptide repeat protein [Sedimentisphaerales bacterium]